MENEVHVFHSCLDGAQNAPPTGPTRFARWKRGPILRTYFSGVRDPDSRQQRRVVIASQRLAGVSMARRLGERLSIGSVRQRRRCTQAREVFRSSSVATNQFKAMPGTGVPVVSCLRALRTRSASVASDQRRSGRAAPAEKRAVTPLPKHRRFAATPRPHVLTDAR